MSGFASKPFRAVAVGVLLLGLAGTAWYDFRFYIAHSTIRQLQDIPVGNSVRLVAAVTGVDSAGSRFWVQDDTGAMVLRRAPGAPVVHVGELLGIEAVKTAHYDDVLGPDSVALKNVRILPLHAQVSLPPASPVSPAQPPMGEKSNTLVELTGVIRAVVPPSDGQVHLMLAQTGATVDVVLPPDTPGVDNLVDSRVRVVGVPEAMRAGSGPVTWWRIWAHSLADVHVEDRAPPQPPLFTIRRIYRDPSIRSGRRIRIRGRMAAWLSPGRMLLEDRWGAIRCEISAGSRPTQGTFVEVAGFPTMDGIRIDLAAAQATEIPHGELDEGPGAGANDSELHTVAAVRSLSQDRAALALPVRIPGVITYNQADWGQMYLQDATGGIYMKYSGAATPLPVGERVTVVGVTNAGNFAPVIVAPKFDDLGAGRLPAPRPVTMIEAASGLLDSQLVELHGIVHPIQAGSASGHLGFELYADFGQVQVFTSSLFSEPMLRQMEDAGVTIRGVFGTVFNSRRQLVGYQLSVAAPSDIQVVEPSIEDPFSVPTTPVGQLLRFSHEARFGHRVKVSGQVTMVAPGSLYLQDGSGGVQITGDTAALHRGDLVEALGYPSLVGRYSPILTDAVFQSQGRQAPELAKAVNVDSILQGQYDSQLVSVEGKLLASIDTPSGKSLLLQSGIHTFTAELGKLDARAQGWPPQEGSVLRVTGISSAQVDPDKLYLLLQEQPVSFRILLRSPADVAVIKEPPFWNLRNAFILVIAFALVILGALVWGSALRRRIRVQRVALRRAAETTQAIADLSHAMSEVSTRQEFDAEVSVRGTPEVAQLVVGFNRMLAELRRAEMANRDAEVRLTRQALTDALTGLPNRRHLAQHLTQSLADAKRHESLMALLYIDLDGFKLVNDSMGHAAGDLLLVEVADRLRAHTRKGDSLARIGGDEFTVILNRIGKKQDAQTVADKLLKTLSETFEIQGQEITVGASIGICTFPDHANDETDLLQQADSAMYAAKRAGRNRAMFFTSDLGFAIRERLTLENELRRALLENRDISVHYQPEFDLVSGALTRFEALARWEHPTLGSIPPSTFIPIAEESGLIISLGASIMDRACREAASWHALLPRPVGVAVNVSSVQFARDSFVVEVMETLQRTGLDPHLLQIELTESAMLIGVQRAAKSMQILRELGVTFAIDDFGTGYSCLSYLPELGFDALKIDRAFVKDLIQRPETRAMVRSLASMAQELSMRVIFEGVETEEQLQLVETMGGHEAQGYVLGRPTPHAAALLGETLSSSRRKGAGRPAAVAKS